MKNYEFRRIDRAAADASAAGTGDFAGYSKPRHPRLLPIHRNIMSRRIPKATGKRYRTTSEMLEDTLTPQHIIDSVREVEAQSAVPLLAGMRVSKGITQKELAQAIGCSEGRISKLETSRDEDLRLQDLLDYTRALSGSLWITIGAPTLGEHIKFHIHALRGLLEELVSLAGED
jgi:transcriptional regulator with XRE-family HTH domain